MQVVICTGKQGHKHETRYEDINYHSHFLDGHTENVTASAKINNSSPEIVSIVNGQIISKAKGNATIDITYQDKLGNFMSKQLYVSSELFPLTEELFNPSIFSNGAQWLRESLLHLCWEFLL